MKSSGDWSNYLSIVFIRALGGGIVGGVAGLFFGIGRRGRGGFILKHLADDKITPVILWFAAWIIGGAIVATFTIPHWQTPWYKGDHQHDNNDT